MACEGFEHGDTVVLQKSLRDLPVGTTGVIRGKNELLHTVDIYVEGMGVLKGMDAHSFILEANYRFRDEMGHGYATGEA